jgi:hypothetical protein
MPKGNPKGKGVDVAKNPLQGKTPNQGKIGFYHLEDRVIALKQAGCTITEIQDTINTKYLTEPDQFLSRMSISRFLSKHMEDYKDLDQRYQNYTVNEYNELLDMLQYSEGQLEVAERTLADIRKAAKETRDFPLDKLEEVQKEVSQVKLGKSTMTVLEKLLDKARKGDRYVNPKDVTALMNATEKALARRQSILSDLVGIKEKIYSFIAMQQIISTIMQKVKDKDIELYAEIRNEFNSDPMIREAFKKIKQ